MMNNPLNMMQNNPMQMMMQKFQQFQKTFTGNPGQMIQQMLNSGKVNQGQYNQAMQMAQQFQRIFFGK